LPGGATRGSHPPAAPRESPDISDTLQARRRQTSLASVGARNVAIQPEWRCLGCPELRGHTTQLPGSQELTALLGDMSCYGREIFSHLYSFLWLFRFLEKYVLGVLSEAG